MASFCRARSFAVLTKIRRDPAASLERPRRAPMPHAGRSLMISLFIAYIPGDGDGVPLNRRNG